jgi:hypothetical protein
MKDHEIVVLVDGIRSPEREFIFAANLARLLCIGTVSCISTGSKSTVSDCHVLLPGGSGEQTFSAGGSSGLVFEASCADLDSARAWAARVAGLRRAARALGVTFGGMNSPGATYPQWVAKSLSIKSSWPPQGIELVRSKSGGSGKSLSLPALRV